MSDLISRQAAIEALDEQIEQRNKSLSSFDISIKDEFVVKVERASLVAFRETLEYLPPAQPERIRGRWTRDNACSECGCQPWFSGDIHNYNFCPHCGADMREVTE